MRRLSSLLFVLFASAFGATSCATYTQDLDRARRHYEANRYEQALALFRVLEHDTDSYSPAEQAQYAYLRGMTDYRLAGLSPQGTGVTDPRKAFRDNARHWLGVAAAIEKATPGGLTADEKQRLNETLTDLNRDVFGGAETLPEQGAAADQPDAAGQPAQPPGDPANPAAPRP
jgi:hypothetical protein